MQHWSLIVIILIVSFMDMQSVSAAEVTINCSLDSSHLMRLGFQSKKHFSVNEDDVLNFKVDTTGVDEPWIHGRVEPRGYLECTPLKHERFIAVKPGNEIADVIYEGGTGPVGTIIVEITVRPLTGQAAVLKNQAEKIYDEKLATLTNIDVQDPKFLVNADILRSIADNGYMIPYENRYRRDKAMDKLKDMVVRLNSYISTHPDAIKVKDYSSLLEFIKEYKFATCNR